MSLWEIYDGLLPDLGIPLWGKMSEKDVGKFVYKTQFELIFL